MKLALTLTAGVFAALVAVDRLYGLDVTYRIASGGIVGLSAMISGTFLWLWRVRATPLALGMALSWAGSASVLAWWWTMAATGASTALSDHPALMGCVAVYTTGAVLHFSVIESSLDWPRGTSVVIPACAFLLSAAATYLL